MDRERKYTHENYREPKKKSDAYHLYNDLATKGMCYLHLVNMTKEQHMT